MGKALSGRVFYRIGRIGLVTCLLYFVMKLSKLGLLLKNMLREEQILSYENGPQLEKRQKGKSCVHSPVTLLHSEQPKLYGVLAYVSAIGLTVGLSLFYFILSSTCESCIDALHWGKHYNSR